MNVTTARTYVRQFARNADDDTYYSDANIDRAIQTVGNDFVYHTRATKRADTYVLTLGDYALPALHADFRAERLLKAYIEPYPELSHVPYQTILDSRNNDSGRGVPSAIGFETATTGAVWPAPDQAYALELLWVEPFTVWTPGTNGDAITINLPDDYLQPLLIYGATAMLQHTEPQSKYARESWAKYERFRTQRMAAMSLTGRTIHREKAPGE